MRWINRVGIDSSFPTDARHFKCCMETALCSHLAAMKRQGVTLATWWDTVKDVATLVIDGVAVEQVIKSENNYHSVAEDLEQLTSASTLGCKMYGFAMAQIVIKRYGDFGEKELDTLSGGISTADLERLTALVESMAQQLRIDELCPEPRDMTMQYQSYDINLSVRSATHE